jgi:predicted alpha/beta-fold hydrolase
MRESQYVEAYLNTTADPDTRWTPDTYLAYTLHGKAKDYSMHYVNALMRALRRREAAGTVTAVRSKGGSTAYIRTGDQEERS